MVDPQKVPMSLLLALVLCVQSSPLIISAQSYQAPISYNSSELVLEEGEQITIPIEFTPEGKAWLEKQRKTVTGNAGTVTLNYVGGGVCSWQVTMFAPFSRLVVSLRATDITSGLGAGYGTYSTSSGTFKVAAISGHLFTVYLDATSYMGVILIAHSNPCSISFVV